MTTWRSSAHRGTAAKVITAVGAVFALIEVVYIFLLLVKANAGNGFFVFIKSLAEPLAVFFPGLFPVSNYNLAVILDYGLAAVFWLVVAGVLARLVGR